MRNRFLVLLMVPAWLFLCIGGAAKPIEETVTAPAAIIEPTEEATTAPTTEPTIPETTEPVVTEPPVTEPPVTESPTTEPEETEPEPKSLGTFKLTAYCACSKCCGSYASNRPVDENGNMIVYTASGARAEAGVTIAVDPRVIPYGTQVVINGHTYTAQDTGGSINGSRIDVYFDNHQDAWDFGTQYAEVFVYETED